MLFTNQSFLFGASTLAQTAGGTFLDESRTRAELFCPALIFTIKNVATGITRAFCQMKRVFTNAANLQPGTYEIMVQLPSFRRGKPKKTSS